jgi:hypothetical protein
MWVPAVAGKQNFRRTGAALARPPFRQDPVGYPGGCHAKPPPGPLPPAFRATAQDRQPDEPPFQSGGRDAIN